MANISFPGAASNSQGGAVNGTPGQSSSTAGTNVNFNQADLHIPHDPGSIITPTNNASNTGTAVGEVTHFDPPPVNAAGISMTPDNVVNMAGTAVVGTPGAASSSTGASEIVTHTDSQISNNINGTAMPVHATGGFHAPPNPITSSGPPEGNVAGAAVTGTPGQPSTITGSGDAHVNVNGGDFPAHSTYSYSHAGADAKSALDQGLHKMGGWGAGAEVPADPANGVLGIDNQKHTNPFDTQSHDGQPKH